MTYPLQDRRCWTSIYLMARLSCTLCSNDELSVLALLSFKGVTVELANKQLRYPYQYGTRPDSILSRLSINRHSPDTLSLTHHSILRKTQLASDECPIKRVTRCMQTDRLLSEVVSMRVRGKPQARGQARCETSLIGPQVPSEKAEGSLIEPSFVQIAHRVIAVTVRPEISSMYELRESRRSVSNVSFR
jgi:hypothetical protein